MDKLSPSHITVVFIGHPAYGDYLSTNGMVRILSQHYAHVMFWCHRGHREYVQTLFHDLTDRFTAVDESELIAYLTAHSDYDVVNYVDVHHPFHSHFQPHIHPSCRQFSAANKEEWVAHFRPFLTDATAVLLPQDEPTPRARHNGEQFYLALQMNPSLLTTAFRYVRDMEQERSCYQDVLHRYQLTPTDRYIVINYPPGDGQDERQYRPMDTRHFDPTVTHVVNIFNLVRNPLHLPLLLEGAEEMHTIENSNALLVYFLQFSRSMKSDKKVFLHMYARTRGSWMTNMYKFPALANWVFLE